MVSWKGPLKIIQSNGYSSNGYFSKHGKRITKVAAVLWPSTAGRNARKFGRKLKHFALTALEKQALATSRKPPASEGLSFWWFHEMLQQL